MNDALTRPSSVNKNKPPASIALDKIGIPHRLFLHEGTVTSFEQAARERGQKPAQVVRSILFQIRPEEFVMVLVAGSEQVDWKKLRQLVRRSRVRMATEDEVLEITGYRVGTVSPFGMARQVKVMIDASVLRMEEVSIGSGVRNTAIILKSADLRRALGDAEMVSLLEESHPS
ncbi:MAG: YbaK/EbsC family protein [Anaerolineae bacterium]|nr:YbaK/EbsC family protein [Anaerolineae bacterium]